ncbi:hypothetical protein GF342_00275 [Candidatus Woesearchaeota archaeon]|nr:hypothetical protein [Candidatus Woesearchaeota archaeon]
MPYDKSLDKQLFSESVEFETTRLTVSVFSYNDGTPKIQIARENKNRDGEWQFAKLGRMVKAEAEAVLPLLKKAVESLD